MFHAKVRGGKAFAAEQKIGQFKKILLRSKRFQKLKKNRIRPNELIKKADKSMKLFRQNTSWRQKQLKKEVWILMTINIFKKYMTLWELKKFKIIKWETINLIEKLIEGKEH